MRIQRFIHVNVVCSDLDRSLDFYSRILGANVHEQFNSGQSDLRRTMAVPQSGSKEYRAALVYWGDDPLGPYIDLVEWTGDTRLLPRSPLRAQDRGLVRVALEVDDLEAWISHLRENEVDLIGPAQLAPVGPWMIWLGLCQDPDGTLIELVEFPKGRKRSRTEQGE